MNQVERTRLTRRTAFQQTGKFKDERAKKKENVDFFLQY